MANKDAVTAKGMGAYGATRPLTDATTVDEFHQQSDVDTRSQSQHHTLGSGQDQSAPGNHTHDGSTSAGLWGGNNITGSRGGNMALASAIALLVQKGAVDSTST